MTFVLRLALDTIVLPAVPVALGAVIASATRRSMARRNVGAIAVASGIVIAHFVDVGMPRLPPIDTIGWIPFAAAVMLFGLVLEERAWARLALVFVVVATTARLVGRPIWHSWIAAAPWALLVGAVAAVIDGSLKIACRRLPPGTPLLAFAMTMAGGSIVCLFGHSALLAQVQGASAAVVGAAGLVAVWVEPAQTIAGIAVVSAFAVIVYARLYATLAVLPAVLLAASAAGPIIASSLPLGRRARAAMAVFLAVAFGGAAAFYATT